MDFNKDKIIQIFLEFNILKNNLICQHWNKLMKLINNKGFKDGKCWRCKKNGQNRHNNLILFIFEKIRENIIFYNSFDKFEL